jgi:hypothetical protein
MDSGIDGGKRIRRRQPGWQVSGEDEDGESAQAYGVTPVGRMATSAMHGSTVLILVRDILGAGLFAALVEGIGKRPLFPFANERPEIAVARLRPAIVLLECYHAAARSGAFFAAAEAAGSRVVLFAPAAPWKDVEEIAQRRRVAAFVHPANGESLGLLIARALED